MPQGRGSKKKKRRPKASIFEDSTARYIGRAREKHNPRLDIPRRSTNLPK